MDGREGRRQGAGAPAVARSARGRRFRARPGTTAALAAALVWIGAVGARADEPFEAYYRLESVRPDRAGTTWADSAQGLATDGAHWYVAQTDRLTKIPATAGLSGPAVASVRLADVPDLFARGLDHFGDPTWYRPPGGAGVVVVPLESRSGDVRPLRVAVFRGTDLAFVGSTALPCTQDPDDCDGTGQHGFGWAAVAPDGSIVSSSKHATGLHVYAAEWRGDGSAAPALRAARRIPLRDESGRSLRLWHLQGGAFSPSGARLYVVTGYLAGGCAPGGEIDGDTMRETGGIHVFDFATGVRVRKSVNGTGLLGYPFDPTLPACDEPEGLAIRSFTGDAASGGLDGELHVLRVTHRLFGTRVSVLHYDGRLYVREDAAPGGDGRRRSPFSRLDDALAAAWPGARIAWQPLDPASERALPRTLDVSGGRVRVTGSALPADAEAPERSPDANGVRVP